MILEVLSRKKELKSKYLKSSLLLEPSNFEGPYSIEDLSLKDLVHIDVILYKVFLKIPNRHMREDPLLFDCYYEAYSAREGLLSIEYSWICISQRKGCFKLTAF